MDKGKSEVVGISFKPYYKKEHEFLESQDNKSRFVCELIRDYLKKNEQESKESE